jgi:potassium efflux system protein
MAKLQAYISRIIGCLIIYAATSIAISAAQTNAADIAFLDAPTSREALQSEMSNVEANTELTAEQKNSVLAAYKAALGEIELAAQSRQDAVRFENELTEAAATEALLRREIELLEANLADDNEPDNLTRSLNVLERELSTLEGELRGYRTELSQYEKTLDTLLQRPLQLGDELLLIRSDEANLEQELSGLGETSSDPRTISARRLLEAQVYRRQIQIIAMERELAGLGTRQELVSLRRELVVMKITRTEARVRLLQSRTGQKRILLSQDVLKQAKSDLSLFEKEHPFIREYAAENYRLAAELSKISLSGGQYPRRLADAQYSLEVAREDLRLADQLIELGNLNRASNTNLRRIQNNRAPLSAIGVEISKTKRDIANQMQSRILAEDKLRDLTVRGSNLRADFKEWQSDNPLQPNMSTADLSYLKSLNSRRKGFLDELLNASSVNIDDANGLLQIQTDWRSQVTDLRSLLNKTLLWTPSSDIIGKNWLGQVFRGTRKLLNPERLGLVGRNLITGSWRYSPLVLLAAMLFLFLIWARKSLCQSLADIAKKVGHVQEDSYWHTPRAIVICGLIALPIPIIFSVIGFILSRAITPDPFVVQLGRTGLDLAGFLWFFLTWQAWNRNGALMGPHFDLSENIRISVNRELKWFIPIGALIIGCVTATQNSRDLDVYSGFSVLAFMAIAVVMSVFAMRVFWVKKDVMQQAAEKGHRVWRYRKTITVLFVGLPLISGLLAFFGFYETARVLLSRLLFSSGLVVSAYVLYGLISRTVLVAQRRISLQQAIERRDRVQKARQEQEAAEERGETLAAPPPVDYDQIDVESISRQTSQLLNTLVAVGFAILMWLFWQDLLPALAAFDNVKIPLGRSIGPSGDIITSSSISLWTILKSIVIITLTVIAGKNLPGFLEVFILDSFKLEPSTRYAIITVLGYLIFAIGITIAFSVLGVEWAKLQWIVAALGVGIGFGLQEIIANFISGLIILFERPIRIGDYVTIGDQSGTVSRIKIRATTLTDLDNREILIPNKEIITGRVINWTLSNAMTRLKVHVGIAYGSDTDRARNIMLDILKAHPKTLSQPCPQVFFLGFGDSSLDFELRAFIASFEDSFPVLDSLHNDINKALEKEGITIPFPQRDLHIKSENIPAAAVASKPAKPSKGKGKAKTS